MYIYMYIYIYIAKLGEKVSIKNGNVINKLRLQMLSMIMFLYIYEIIDVFPMLCH